MRLHRKTLIVPFCRYKDVQELGDLEAGSFACPILPQPPDK